MESFDAALGSWTGTYEVWFDAGAPVSRSSSNLEVAEDDSEIRMNYDWAFQDTPTAGSYVFTSDGGMMLTDSFHTEGKTMSCRPDSPMTFLGSFEAEGQTWGWKTSFEIDARLIVITAWNVAPDGEATKATEARYSRRYS